MDQRWRRLDGKKLARMLHSYGMNQTNNDQRIGARDTKGYQQEYFEESGRGTCHCGNIGYIGRRPG